ncbi:MAG: hypothetical protein WCO57_09400 [Verrucomicrobiota bacterium]
MSAGWLGLAAMGSGKEILTHTEPAGEKITLSCPFEWDSSSDRPAWCFMPVDIEAQNPGKNPTAWQVSLSSRDYQSNTTVRSGFEFKSPPKAVTRGSLLVPMGAVEESGFAHGDAYYTMEATRTGGGTGNASFNTSSRSNNPARSTLMTKGVVARFGSRTEVVFEPARAPGDWRAYCGFHSLCITDQEWRDLPPAARTAIQHWVRLGGHLFVQSSTSGPSAIDTPKSDLGQDTGVVCRGAIAKLTSAKPDLDALYGIIKAANNDWVAGAITGKTVQDWERRAQGTFALPSAKLVAGFMLAVVVGFAILVGPLNVFVFAAARRRHRLFLTTPLISLAAGGLLAISILLSDGLGGTGVRCVWMESVPGGDNTHYIVQHQHSRCGAMFATGFEIPEDAYFVPMILSPGELSGNLSMELEPGKVIATGPWFSSRRSQNFYLAAARPGRGRIEQSGPADRPVLTSAFDFPIERMFWLAADGTTWWQAGAMAQGTATALQPCSAAEVEQAVATATAHAPAEYANDLTKASRRPGHFLALASGIAAIETHKGIRWQTQGFVTGRVVTP